MKVIEILLCTIIILVSSFILVQSWNQIELMKNNIQRLENQITEVYACNGHNQSTTKSNDISVQR